VIPSQAPRPEASSAAGPWNGAKPPGQALEELSSVTALNLTLTSTEDVSAALGFAGVAEGDQIVQALQLVADGVTVFDEVDAGPVPTPLVAATLKV
jgi:hypothetical protein